MLKRLHKTLWRHVRVQALGAGAFVFRAHPILAVAADRAHQRRSLQVRPRRKPGVRLNVNAAYWFAQGPWDQIRAAWLNPGVAAPVWPPRRSRKPLKRFIKSVGTQRTRRHLWRRGAVTAAAPSGIAA